ncbi:hypothetical protein [Curtobacterium sp. 9128]|uniref:hypothetical protein n=1 Tax=Curtobacterium sp. 9128 TaxID=1793722 RepID=UPI0011A2F43F|nr:hypothetical protein [Curtobacterium sp. 9128]
MKESAVATTQLRSLYVGNYREADLRPLTGHTELRSLRLKDRPALRSLAGAEAFERLQHLEVVGASRLEDFRSLSELAVGLESLWIESCRRLDQIDFVRRLTALVRLAIADCGRIESLHPLAGLAHLREVILWESTHVADGDLSPLLDLPQLEEFRLRSRPLYTPSVREVAAHLGLVHP